MLKDNLARLRNLYGYSQEELADKIHISRQAYAKWESGATVPDIDKCSLLAAVYGVTLDSLVQADAAQRTEASLLVPKGKNIWGSVTMNDRGQIVIPKETRARFGFTGGTRLIVLSDEEGIALISAERFEQHLNEVMKMAAASKDEP